MLDNNEVTRLKKLAISSITEQEQELSELSLMIHSNPELGFKEHKAAGWLAEYLNENGFLLEKGICDMPTAFRASYGSGSPKISFLAEYDALPEIGHACGHNLIAIAAIGAAASVKKAVDLCGGTVYVIGTPAEELIGGKVKMAKEGIFNRFDAAMMVHPGTYDTATITALAAVALDIEFIGREAHASARPEDGINALDAMILAFGAMNKLKEQIGKNERIHGIITDGGRAANIIPARSAANFLVRAENKEALEKLKGKALTCFTDAAKQVGARLNYKWGDSAYAPMLNNTLLASLFIDNMKQLGCQMPLSDEREKFGSTDMGNVSQVVPAIHPMLSIANENISVHSPEFADAAASEQGLNAIILSSKALAMTAIDLLTTPKHITEIRQEFIESL